MIHNGPWQEGEIMLQIPRGLCLQTPLCLGATSADWWYHLSVGQFWPILSGKETISQWI